MVLVNIHATALLDIKEKTVKVRMWSEAGRGWNKLPKTFSKLVQGLQTVIVIQANTYKSRVRLT